VQAIPEKLKVVNLSIVPALFEGPDFPIVVAGATTFGGQLTAFSQDGPHVFLYAPGERITCLGGNSKTLLTDKEGTSFATTITSGEVANLLSYDKVPFDTSNGNLVKNLRDYLKTDAGSWPRYTKADDPKNPNAKDYRLVWNGVTKEHNPKIAENSAPSTPTPAKPAVHQCYGVASRKYIGKSDLADIFEKNFCPDVVKQGAVDKNSRSIVRRYNQGTCGDVILAIDGTPGVPFKAPNKTIARRTSKTTLSILVTRRKRITPRNTMEVA